jgi:hypothetical protein
MEKKRRFCGNRYTGSLKKPKIEFTSRSAKKLADVRYDVDRPQGITGFRLVDVDVLCEFIFETLVC